MFQSHAPWVHTRCILKLFCFLQDYFCQSTCNLIAQLSTICIFCVVLTTLTLPELYSYVYYFLKTLLYAKILQISTPSIMQQTIWSCKSFACMYCTIQQCNNDCMSSSILIYIVCKSIYVASYKLLPKLIYLLNQTI